MKQKTGQTILFSTVGIVAMLLIVIAINLISSAFKARIDLTEEKAYTLSPGTKAILKKLDTPVKIRFYVTEGANDMPVFFKNYADRVEDLLDEYRQASGGKIRIDKLNPQPDSEAEDSANLDGVEGQMLNIGGGERIYLGLAISQLDEKVALPFLSPDRERLLEYDITRAIARVANPEKPKVAVLTTLPIFGQPMNPMLAQAGQRGSEPWVFVSELKRDFDVQQIEPTAESIPDEIKVLAVIHPKDITDATQFAIDQFLMKGGKLLVYVDSHAYFDQPRNQANPMMNFGAGKSNLEKLFRQWGLAFDTTKVVADLNFASRNRQGVMPAVLLLNQEAINQDDVVTSQVNTLLLPFPGAFTGTPAEGLKQTVLLTSSSNAFLIDAMMASMAGEQATRDFKGAGSQYNLGVRLTGKFKTAFPDGKPKTADAETNKTSVATTALKESPETTVTLIGDVDLLNDQVSVQVQEIFNQRIVIPQNGNLNLTQSLVEQLSGDQNLISLRSRASMNRPFTVVRKMEAEAQENYRATIQKAEEELQQTQQRLNDLQRNKQPGQRFILSPEQEAEVEKFRKRESEVKAELKKLRRNLRQETDALEFWTKVINIGAMPLAVALTGIVLAIVKRKRTAAK